MQKSKTMRAIFLPSASGNLVTIFQATPRSGRRAHHHLGRLLIRYKLLLIDKIWRIVSLSARSQ